MKGNLFLILIMLGCWFVEVCKAQLQNLTTSTLQQMVVSFSHLTSKWRRLFLGHSSYGLFSVSVKPPTFLCSVKMNCYLQQVYTHPDLTNMSFVLNFFFPFFFLGLLLLIFFSLFHFSLVSTSKQKKKEHKEEQIFILLCVCHETESKRERERTTLLL